MVTKDFEAFKGRIDREFMHHPVVVGNDYTRWFGAGEMSLNHLRFFTIQFSVFSNQFLLAALNRVINADTLQAARESKEIVMNELGVIYNRARSDGGAGTTPVDVDREGDPALVSTEGTVDGGRFRFQAAHLEWLLRFGAPIGLRFEDMGKRRHGTPSTLFCRGSDPFGPLRPGKQETLPSQGRRHPMRKEGSAEKVVQDIRRKTRRRFSVEEKIRIVLEGLRGEESIATLCRKEGLAPNLYYRWSKEFLEAGKRRLVGDTTREATSTEVTDLRTENGRLKQLVAEVVLENRLLKKSVTASTLEEGAPCD